MGGWNVYRFLNVLSFLYQQDLTIDVAGLGQVAYDIAFSGAFMPMWMSINPR